MITRRMFVSGGAALAAAAAIRPHSAHAVLSYGTPVKFSWEALQSWAEAASKMPYQPPQPSHRDIIHRINYDEHRQIRYRPEAGIVPETGAYPIELFHVGRYFEEPVRVFIVDGGASREVLYSNQLFSYGKATFAQDLPHDIGFAGVRIMQAKGQPDWISFLGASYFRSPGETKQYGLSARGLAIDTGFPEPEEFPRFSNFWIEALDNEDGMMIYAFLDSASVTGAYRIRATRQTGVVTKIDMVLHARKDVRRLGIGPLTSMYWYGKLNREDAVDWRPEIHDSDGLAIWTGAGEHIWRPLNNPPETKLSSFFDKSPKGFGLLQRERDFEAYQDDGVFYNRRPSAWVEPIGDWGEGAVQLLEIPTKDETSDNIVAFWNPKDPYRAGDRIALSYRVHWRNDVPFRLGHARVVATRRGEGGVPGGERRPGVTKYVVDFEGGKLSEGVDRDRVKLRVSASHGRCDEQAAYPVVDTNRWRALFDYKPARPDAADLRVHLDYDDEPITESWVYQHVEPLGHG